MLATKFHLDCASCEGSGSTGRYKQCGPQCCRADDPAEVRCYEDCAKCGGEGYVEAIECAVCCEHEPKSTAVDGKCAYCAKRGASC